MTPRLEAHMPHAQASDQVGRMPGGINTTNMTGEASHVVHQAWPGMFDSLELINSKQSELNIFSDSQMWNIDGLDDQLRLSKSASPHRTATVLHESDFDGARGSWRSACCYSSMNHQGAMLVIGRQASCIRFWSHWVSGYRSALLRVMACNHMHSKKCWSRPPDQMGEQTMARPVELCGPVADNCGMQAGCGICMSSRSGQEVRS